MQMRQKCLVWKNRKFPISVETQQSTAAARIKHCSCESALNSDWLKISRTKDLIYAPGDTNTNSLNIFSMIFCKGKFGLKQSPIL